MARRVHVDVTTEQARRAVLELYGTHHPLQAAEQLHREREAQQAFVVGDAARVAEQIARTLRLLDADLHLAIPFPMDAARTCRSIELFARDIAPRVRQQLVGTW